MAVEDLKTEDKLENTDELVAPEEVIDDEPLLEPEGLPEPDTNKNKVHPLTPGGRRFEQVYAEGKQAKRDLAKERELRIAAEAKLEVLSGKTVSTETTDVDKEYTWAELENFIKEGRITRADAEAHREEIIERRVSKKISNKLAQETTTVSRTNALTGSINAYCKAVPAILVAGSEDRVRLDEEFDFLASVQGLDPAKIDEPTRKALQLTALRAVYGPVDVLDTRTASHVTPVTQQELPGGRRPERKVNADQALLDNLTKKEVAHYNKMFRTGRYPNGWKDVVEELKYEAPKQVRR